MTTIALDPLLGLPQAAANLEMTPSELRRLVAAREIAVVRRGSRGHIKIRLSEIESWKRRNTIPARKPRGEAAAG